MISDNDLAMLQRLLTAEADWEHQWETTNMDNTLHVDTEIIEKVADEFSHRLRENYPVFHPRYAAQMIKPPHPLAMAAYFAAMQINPNNHALDGGPATAKMEMEAVAEIASMFGYSSHLGHLTSSGTIANLEALWISKCLHPHKAIAFSSQSHYTHRRMCEVIGAESTEVPTDAHGRMDLGALESLLRNHTVGTVVATVGTTSLGAIDPVHEMVSLCQKYGVRIHADAAYGGFFALLAQQKESPVQREPFQALASCDSIVVDPHKHGLQPYGCGCVLFRDPSVGKYYKHDSPYTYFTSKELHLGEISLECSRAGAAAAALWFTLHCIPLQPEKGFGPILRKTRLAALEWSRLIKNSELISEFVPPELDIVHYYPNTTPLCSSAVSARTNLLFNTAMQHPSQPIFLALLSIDSNHLKYFSPTFASDNPRTTIIRSVLMKPEHLRFVPQLFEEVVSFVRSAS